MSHDVGLGSTRFQYYLDLKTFPKSRNGHPDFKRVLRRLEVERAALRHKEAMIQIWYALVAHKEETGEAFSIHENKFKTNMEKWYNMFEPSDICNFKSDVALAMCHPKNTDETKIACESMERLNHIEKCMKNAKKGQVLAPIPIKKTIE